jgi:hypothetical protein
MSWLAAVGVLWIGATVVYLIAVRIRGASWMGTLGRTALVVTCSAVMAVLAIIAAAVTFGVSFMPFLSRPAHEGTRNLIVLVSMMAIVIGVPSFAYRLERKRKRPPTAR